METRHAWVLAFVLLFALGTGCNRTKECRPGTILLEYSIPSSVGLPVQFQVSVSVDGVSKTTTTALSRQSGSIQIDFPSGYPIGKTVTIDFKSDRLAGTTVLAAVAGCTVGELSITAEDESDMTPSTSDMSSPNDSSPLDAQLDGPTTPDLVVSNALASFSLTLGKSTVEEHEPFDVTIEAKRGDGSILTQYSSTPAISSSWGDVTLLSPIVFNSGVAIVSMSLNRETPSPTPGVIVTITDGITSAMTDAITVNHPAPSILGNAIFPTSVYDAAIATDGSKILIWKTEGNSIDLYSTSAIDVAATKDVASPVFGPGAAAWENMSVSVLSVFRNGSANMFTMLYLGRSSNVTLAPGLGLAVSTDGKTWNRTGGIAPLVFSGAPTECATDTTGGSYGRLAWDDPGYILVFSSNSTGTMCVSKSPNLADWSTPAVLSPAASGWAINTLIKDGSVYRAYYEGFPGVGGSAAVHATSQDGTTWTRSGVATNPILYWTGSAYEGWDPISQKRYRRR